MVAQETEVIRATRIYEGEPAGRSRIPGVGRNLVEGACNCASSGPMCMTSAIRAEIYGARQPLAIANELASP
jgi:hypothetical protein